MKKKVLSILAVLSLATSIGFASPLNDFSQGKVALDVAARPSADIEVSSTDLNGTIDGKNSYDFGLTVGLGNNFAFQYRNFNPKSKDYSIDSETYNGQLKTQEFNVLYQIDKNYTVFAGVNQVKSKYNLGEVGRVTGDTNNNWQVGLTGQAPLGDKFTGYATVAAGKDNNAWKLGLSYAIDKSLDFDLFYAQNKYDNVKLTKEAPDSADYTIKGFGYGLTYKF